MRKENTIVLVGCSSDKSSKREYSWKLYNTDYFEKKMTVAMLMGQPAVLSGKYGIVFCNERIDPYESDLREKDEHEIQSWALSIANDFPDHFENVVFLASKIYRTPLKSLLEEDGYNVFSPFEREDIRGIGDQIGWCHSTSQSLVDGENPKDFMQ